MPVSHRTGNRASRTVYSPRRTNANGMREGSRTAGETVLSSAWEKANRQQDHVPA
jgi:hypothetical protein